LKQAPLTFEPYHSIIFVLHYTIIIYLTAPTIYYSIES
jgi:hypothetical protein